MRHHGPPRNLPLAVEVCESVVDKVGPDFPSVASSLLQWVQS